MLQRLLVEKKKAILHRWHEQILDSYPADTSNFLRGERDRFSNPVGHALSQGIEAIYEGLVEGRGFTKESPELDEIIRIRSVQDFSPSQAVFFIFQLKGLIREELGEQIRKSGIWEELANFEARIDELALFAFDNYSACREKLYQIRLKEMKGRALSVIELRKQKETMKDKE